MREILTIIGKETDMIHHYCLDGIDLDNLPSSRTGEAIIRLRECSDTCSMSFEHIKKELLNENPDKIYKTRNGNVEEFWTKPKEAEEHIIYRVDKIKEDKIWGIVRWGNMEYIKYYNPDKDILNAPVDPYTNYCPEIVSKAKKRHENKERGIYGE